MDVKPQKIIRLDDGAEFVLNEKGEYALKINESTNGSWSYTYERLMEDPRNKGAFKVADGTEDLEAMRKAWRDKVLRRKVIYEMDYYGGHGDEDDI